MTTHGRVDEYLDGHLSTAGEVAFLDHLTECPVCEGELEQGDASASQYEAPPALGDLLWLLGSPDED